MYDFRNPQFRHQLAVSMNIANNQKLDYPSKFRQTQGIYLMYRSLLSLVHMINSKITYYPRYLRYLRYLRY